MSNIQQVLKSLDNQNKIIREQLAINILKAGNYYEGEVAKETPVKTGDLASTIHRGELIVEPERIAVRVGTNSSYGLYVEFGIEGKTFNYHKGDRIFKRGTGANMFRGTLKKNAKIINGIIKG